MLIVNECFTSLQGESSFAGKVCAFIRLAGCSLRCRYCDTKYAISPASGRETSIEELLSFVRESGVSLVEVTGGEPLEQPETPELLASLVAAEFTVLLETNGTCSIADLPQEVIRIMDVKLPGSGMETKMLSSNYSLLTPRDEVKFVIGSRADYEAAKTIIAAHHLDKIGCRLIASPVWGTMKFDELAAWLVADGSPLQMQLQLHKLIWGDKKGV